VKVKGDPKRARTSSFVEPTVKYSDGTGSSVGFGVEFADGGDLDGAVAEKVQYLTSKEHI
jgi:hypothetical protein